MNLKVAASCCVALLLAAQPVLADVVVLKDGTKHAGTLANREDLRFAGRAGRPVSILLSGTGELMRIQARQIEYVVVQDVSGEQVVDFSALRAARPEGEGGRMSGGSAFGSALAQLGIGTLTLVGGILLETDSRQASLLGSRTFGALNLLMVGVGAFLMGSGAVSLAAAENHGGDHLGYRECGDPYRAEPIPAGAAPGGSLAARTAAALTVSMSVGF
jgi:hypothetical protein